jgi:hypothetical protein
LISLKGAGVGEGVELEWKKIEFRDTLGSKGREWVVLQIAKKRDRMGGRPLSRRQGRVRVTSRKDSSMNQCEDISLHSKCST